MADEDVAFLDARGFAYWHPHLVVDQAAQFATVAAEQAERGDAHVSRLFHGGDDVAAVAAGGNADQQIAGTRQGFDLAREHALITEIVGDAGLYIEPPFDSAAIRVGLNKLLNLTSAQKQSLVVSARQQVAQFTWEKTAKIILKSIFERYGRTH